MSFFKTLLSCTALAFLAAGVNAQSANISRTDVSVSGVSLAAMQNAAGKTYFTNDGQTVVVVKNSTGAPVTATIKSQKTSVYKEGYGTATLADSAVVVPSSTIVVIGPFPTGRWNNLSSTVEVSLSTVTGVSATALRVGK